jgi:hypothetical protein
LCASLSDDDSGCQNWGQNDEGQQEEIIRYDIISGFYE